MSSDVEEDNVTVAASVNGLWRHDDAPPSQPLFGLAGPLAALEVALAAR
jgi:hypothetical protein